MLFKVTHINEAGKRHKAWVSAKNRRDAEDQMEREFGEALRQSCMVFQTQPVLRLVQPNGGRHPCAV